MAEQPIEESLPVVAPPSGSRRWIAVGAILLVLGAAGWGTRILIQDADDTASMQGGDKVVFVLHLDTFVINLADPDEKAYLRAGIDLGLNRVPGEKGEGAVPVSLVRDAILEVLALGKPDELMTAEGKTKLKADLLSSLRRRAPGLGVESVYFTEFLIQR